MPQSIIGTDDVQAPATTITNNYTSDWQDTGGGNTLLPFNLAVLIQGVIGNPQVLFGIEVSDDQSLVISAGFDQKGTCNQIGLRNIRFFSERRYWRLVAKWGWQEPVGGSKNSSSSSSQTFNSSSSGGGMSMTFAAYMAASRTGGL